jgi:hypothetical protein
MRARLLPAFALSLVAFLGRAAHAADMPAGST